MSAALGSTRRHRIARTVALVLGIVMVAAACEPVFWNAAHEHQQNDPTTRPWWCDSTGGGHGDHNPDPDPYAGVVKGELSWDDCFANSAAFDMANEYTQQWPTAADAEADGWYRVVGYASGMGTHHGPAAAADIITSPGFDPDNPEFPGTTLDENFNGARPEYLMYDGNGPDAKLTGMAWWVKSPGGPPEGFRGENDWWHQHPFVCLSATTATWIGQDMTDAACTAAGGINIDFTDWWMLHAWINPSWELHRDVFENHHPCLMPSPQPDPTDPCWDVAESF